jgi:hypothetical protein
MLMLPTFTRQWTTFENWLSDRINKTEQENGLTLSWVRTPFDLKLSGKRGLFSMYCDVFAEEPYCEKFTPQEVQDYFEGLVAANGFVFTASMPRKAAPALLTAFVASQPLANKNSVISLVSPYINVSSSAYFAEDAVIPERRREGISRSMKRLLLETNKMAGYETMLLRTSADSFRQAAAVQQLGAKPIEGLSQDVDSLRLDGTTTSDRRIFFTFDLNAFSSEI